MDIPKERIKEWNKMSPEQKAKWNGFMGYVKGELHQETSLFKSQGRRKNDKRN